MTATTFTAAPTRPIKGVVTEGFENFRTAFAAWAHAYVERRSRRAEIEKLDALSDADLARLGLTRDHIVAHVFRDKMTWS